MIKRILIALFILSPCMVKSQQLPVISNYHQNKYIYNPAFAGHEGYTSLDLIAKQQWLGFKGAPQVQYLSFYSLVGKNRNNSSTSSLGNIRDITFTGSRNGIGGVIYNDINGMIRKTGLQLSYAYHIVFPGSSLSFGLSACSYQFKINEANLVYFDINDSKITDNKLNYIIPDANTGIFFSTPQIHFGFAVHNLLQSKFTLGKPTGESLLLSTLHYSILGGYRFDLSNYISNETSFHIKAASPTNADVDISSRIIYDMNHTLGFIYRYGYLHSAIAVIIGTRVNQYHIAYAYDHEFSEISSLSMGSHELLFSYRIGENRNKYKLK